MSIEQLKNLIVELRKCGGEYKPGFNHSNKIAADKIKTLCLTDKNNPADPITYTVESLEIRVLNELASIFHEVETSANLLPNVKKTLITYPPFKNLNISEPSNKVNAAQHFSNTLMLFQINLMNENYNKMKKSPRQAVEQVNKEEAEVPGIRKAM